MSLVLKFKICESSNCSKLIFSELTGVYNVTTNPGGWFGRYGDPNPQIANATSAILTITPSSGTVYSIDLFDTFPTLDKTFEYQLTNEDFGYTTGKKIQDQIITFTYTVIASGVTYTQTIYKALLCNSRCCVDNILKSVDTECNECNDAAIKRYTQARLILDIIESDAECGNISFFNKSLAQLNKICSDTNCKPCNK